jgi:hypothetical protein
VVCNDLRIGWCWCENGKSKEMQLPHFGEEKELRLEFRKWYWIWVFVLRSFEWNFGGVFCCDFVWKCLKEWKKAIYTNSLFPIMGMVIVHCVQTIHLVHCIALHSPHKRDVWNRGEITLKFWGDEFRLWEFGLMFICCFIMLDVKWMNFRWSISILPDVDNNWIVINPRAIRTLLDLDWIFSITEEMDTRLLEKKKGEYFPVPCLEISFNIKN